MPFVYNYQHESMAWLFCCKRRWYHTCERYFCLMIEGRLMFVRIVIQLQGRSSTLYNIWLTFLGCGPRGGESRSKPYIWNTHHYYHVQTIIDRWNESCICLITFKILIKYDYLSNWNYVNIEVSITYNMAWQIEILPFQELFLYFSNSHFIKAYSNFFA